MPKRLARNPSTASLTPAARNSRNAKRISPEVIAQTTTGTSRMRASVMRLGMLTLVFRFRRFAPKEDHPGFARLARRDARGRRLVGEYSGGQAIAQSLIPKYPALDRSTDGGPSGCGPRLAPREPRSRQACDHDQEARRR